MQKHMRIYPLLFALMAAGILACMLYIILMLHNSPGIHIPKGAQLVWEVNRLVRT